MIFNRPLALWVSLSAAILAFAQVLIVNLVPAVDPTVVATLLGSLGGLLTVILTIIANGPPQVPAGAEYTLVTAPGLPNRTLTAPDIDELETPPVLPGVPN